MKALNTLLLAGSAAAAVVGICLAASAFGSTLTPNQLGTPDDGVICRSGYTGALVGTAFKCSKTALVTVAMKCTNANGTYVVRAPGQADSASGIDLCTRPGVSVGSTDAVAGLVKNKDYAYVVVDTELVTQKTSAANQSEAAALGLNANEVETVAGEPKVIPSSGAGSRDRAEVQLTHYTFAIKTGAINTALR